MRGNPELKYRITLVGFFSKWMRDNLKHTSSVNLKQDVGEKKTGSHLIQDNIT
jgi:hypothetical protein